MALLASRRTGLSDAVTAGFHGGVPLGKRGEFYFENLPPGRHPADVRGSDERCELTLTVPRSDEPFVDVGAVRCAPGDPLPDSAPTR